MMNNKIRGYFVLLSGLIVFNVIVLVIPVEHNSTFWIVYSFTNFAFLSQIGIWKWAFSNAEALKSKFLGIPLTYVGLIYLLVQIISFVFSLAYSVEDWIAVVVCIAVLGLSAIMLISGDIGRVEIEQVEKKKTEKTTFIKVIRVELEILFEKESNQEIKRELRELADIVRYCDPTSSSATKSVDESIQQIIAKWKDSGVVLGEIDHLKNLINTRKRLLISNK